MILTSSLRTEGAYERPLGPDVSEGMSVTVLERLDVDLGPCDVSLVLPGMAEPQSLTAEAHLLMACFCFV